MTDSPIPSQILCTSNADQLDLVLPMARDRVDGVGKVDAFVLEAETECRFDDTDYVEALADASVGKRQLDGELVDLFLEGSDFEENDDVDGISVANFLEVDFDSEGSDRNGVDSRSLSVEGYVSLVMVHEELFEVCVSNDFDIFVEGPVQDWGRIHYGVGSRCLVVVAHIVDMKGNVKMLD